MLPEPVSLPLAWDEFSQIIDVRAPAEFEEDHLPGAINLPVLSDAERHEVGLLHATNAFDARRVGATLVTKNIHHHLAETLQDKPRDYAPLLYCWRGQMRSRSFATILKAVGWRARVLQGGYKSWRKWLMADLPRVIDENPWQFHVLSGLTGCGKTRLLYELEAQGAQILDLEGLANHKGSILGEPWQSEQPNQKLFESRLWHTFTKLDPARPIFIEAEANRIGKIQVPPALWHQLAKAQVTEIGLPLPERAKLLAADYPHFIDHPDDLAATLDRLRKLRSNETVDRWHAQIAAKDWPAFLESILRDHYDLSYRRAGDPGSNYHLPAQTITIPTFTEKDLAQTAHQLLSIPSA